MIVTYEIMGETYTVHLEQQPDELYRVTIGEHNYRVAAQALSDGAWLLSIDGVRETAHVASHGLERFVHVGGQHITINVPDTTHRRRGSGHGGDLTAQMPGQVRDVLIKVGDVVQRGQTLLILEAMKMEIRVAAPENGVVKNVLVSTGDTVERGQTLLELVASDDQSAGT